MHNLYPSFDFVTRETVTYKIAFLEISQTKQYIIRQS